jgi:hypothetical protein
MQGNSILNSSFKDTLTIHSSDSESVLFLDGFIPNSRYLEFRQAGSPEAQIGIDTTKHFIILDRINNRQVFRCDLASGTGTSCINFPTYTNGTLSVDNNGNMTSSSDRRLKQNEEVLIPSESLQKINSLIPKKYSWKTNSEKVKIGFVAQDVETIIPEAVDGKKFEYDFIRNMENGFNGEIQLDENGIPLLDHNKPRYRGLDQCAILSTLVSAVQELTARITVLESKLQ